METKEEIDRNIVDEGVKHITEATRRIRESQGEKLNEKEVERIKREAEESVREALSGLSEEERVELEKEWREKKEK